MRLPCWGDCIRWECVKLRIKADTWSSNASGFWLDVAPIQLENGFEKISFAYPA